MVLFSMTVIVTPVTVISRYQSHMVTIDAISVLCAQLTRDLFAIAKFLFFFHNQAGSLQVCHVV